MSILDQAGRLSAAGRRAEAIALVEQAAADEDPEALFALANWRLFGLFGARDLPVARRLLDSAASLGFVEAVRTKAVLTANGTFGAPDFTEGKRLLQTIGAGDSHAAAQLDLLAAMPPTGQFTLEAAITLADAPVVRRFDGLLSAAECRHLIAQAEPQLQPSFVTNPRTGARMPHPIRTSAGMSFGPTQEDLVVRVLNERIARVSGTEVAFGEPLHVLRYTAGQEYRPHNDAVPGDANPRAWTVLVYLNDDYEGGATVFPAIGLEVRGRAGDALIFSNLQAEGRVDPASLHAGRPVTRGVKWLATRWIRQAPVGSWLN